uniref:Kazal-like domain-containing protein n=1 Tax=Heliothis virescens TaxID=7102 RepID=A0A2A4K377_HELVI
MEPRDCGIIQQGAVEAQDYGAIPPLKFRMNPAPDGHRCGVCPTYFQKICAFDFKTNSTFIFDNHCVMDLYNCMERTGFFPMKYEKCLFFGNFAYVHGFKHEDIDYGEDHVIVKQSKKNPDFI